MHPENELLEKIIDQLHHEKNYQILLSTAFRAFSISLIKKVSFTGGIKTSNSLVVILMKK